jgi:hypothetical protein
MNYYADIQLYFGDTHRKACLSITADTFGQASRTFEVWQSAVEATLPDCKIELEGLSSKKRKGSDPIPMLATELLKTIFRPLAVKENG